MRVRLIFALFLLGALPATALVAASRGSSGVPGSTQAPPDASGCFTDTTQGDFQAGQAPVNCDFTTSPGSVILEQGAVIDQQNTTLAATGSFGITATSWGAQTFTAAVSGSLTQAELNLYCAGCSGANPNLTVSIRNVNMNQGQPTTGHPTGADLATATLAGFSSATRTYYSVTFATPAAVVAGNVYAVIVRPVSNRTGVYAYSCSCVDPDSNPYAGGARVTSGTSGATWALDANSGGRDLGFKIHVDAGYAPTGTFTSSLKDSGVDGSAIWGTLNWNASVPGGTTLAFQVAGSDNAGGPFTFVGPDGTGATYYTNGGSLSQFNGKRYLRYRAHMTSTGGATPSLNDVTICFSTTAPPVVDLNGDGIGDVFTYSTSSGAWKRALSQGDGTFSEANGSWDPSWTVVPAMFDDDGLTDMFLFNTTSGQWFRMLNDGASGFTAQAMGTWWNGWQRFVMDLNGDGLSDVFLYDPVSGVWFKAIVTPSPDFEYFQGGWNPDWEITPMTLNNDAIDDMFLINRTTGRWFLMHGEVGGGIEIAATDVWFQGWNLYPGDFNGDDVEDLLLHDPATGTYFVAMNNGTGTGYTYTSGGWSLGWTPYVGDLDADGDQDLFLHDPATGVWFEMISNGAGSFSAAGSQTWSLGWNIYTTDLNGDGRTDFLLYHPGTGVWYQARNFTLGTFTYTSGTWNQNLVVLVRLPYR